MLKLVHRKLRLHPHKGEESCPVQDSNVIMHACIIFSISQREDQSLIMAGSGEMAKWLRVLPVPPEEWDLVSLTYTSQSSFVFMGVCTQWHRQRQRDTNTHTNK